MKSQILSFVMPMIPPALWILFAVAVAAEAVSLEYRSPASEEPQRAPIEAAVPMGIRG